MVTGEGHGRKRSNVGKMLRQERKSEVLRLAGTERKPAAGTQWHSPFDITLESFRSWKKHQKQEKKGATVDVIYKIFHELVKFLVVLENPFLLNAAQEVATFLGTGSSYWYVTLANACMKIRLSPLLSWEHHTHGMDSIPAFYVETKVTR